LTVGFEKTGAIRFYELERMVKLHRGSVLKTIPGYTFLCLLNRDQMSRMMKTMSSVIIITKLSGAWCPIEMQLECNEAVGALMAQ